MNRKDDENQAPWYRYSMVWIMMALPLIAVIASLYTVTIAFNNPPQLIEKEVVVESD